MIEDWFHGVKRRIVHRCLPPPVSVRHSEYSMLLSADDDHSQPTPEQVELSLEVIRAASKIQFSELSSRMSGPPYYPDVWPGEHYRLLAGFVQVLQPKVVVEIGTASGFSSLAIKETLPADGKIVTYDIVPWKQFPGVVLTDDDFEDGRLEQRVCDLSVASEARMQSGILKTGEFFFIDAAKDGQQEQSFFDNLRTVGLASPWVVFDDIRLWNMLRFWRLIPMPKLDMTSFGHWSGTGLVQWQDGNTPNVR
ncbi:MAG: class I SAM-dependent methyltransferase [Elusimicrobiota bacterium]